MNYVRTKKQRFAFYQQLKNEFDRRDSNDLYTNPEDEDLKSIHGTYYRGPRCEGVRVAFTIDTSDNSWWVTDERYSESEMGGWGDVHTENPKWNIGAPPAYKPGQLLRDTRTGAIVMILTEAYLYTGGMWKNAWFHDVLYEGQIESDTIHELKRSFVEAN